jgi:hypothetical protein
MINAHKDHRTGKPAVFEQDDLALGGDDFGIRQATLSSALTSVFPARFAMPFCLTDRQPFSRRPTYDVGEKERTFFFLLSGFVKVGTITVAEADFRTASIARASFEKESLSLPGYGIRRSAGS